MAKVFGDRYMPNMKCKCNLLSLLQAQLMANNMVLELLQPHRGSVCVSSPAISKIVLKHKGTSFSNPAHPIVCSNEMASNPYGRNIKILTELNEHKYHFLTGQCQALSFYIKQYCHCLYILATYNEFAHVMLHR